LGSSRGPPEAATIAAAAVTEEVAEAADVAEEAGAAAGVCFYFGLDDDRDEFRFAHGLSHLFGGLALTFLWNLVPRPKKKSEDSLSKLPSYH